MTHQIIIPYQIVPNTALSERDKGLREEAIRIAQVAYAPYSGFYVGSAVLLANGVIITGNNQENAAYPSGLCAERTALFYAGAQYPNTAIEAMVIVAYNRDRCVPIAPCGACRQVMLESASRQAKPYRVLLCGVEETIIIDDVRGLLPFAFDASSLS